ncbi:MAG: ProQ/FINO family protein [Neisseriaceae bacterium]|nr:ProQ/FINO family protein [Neisseriaceae bacterium]MCV2508865.1 ProQ/FINO family protein [Neisseriaceae bacterium]
MDKERKTLRLKKPRSTDSTSLRRRRRTKVEVIVKNKNPFEKRVKAGKVKSQKQIPIPKDQKKPRVQTPPSTKKKKGPYSIAPKVRMPVSEATKILQTYWSCLFDGDQIKPLQIGILQSLKQDARDRNLPITGKTIKHCLSSLTYTLSYRLSIQSGQARYDKDGQVCGYITAADELDSKQRILRTMNTQKTINPFVTYL